MNLFCFLWDSRWIDKIAYEKAKNATNHWHTHPHMNSPPKSCLRHDHWIVIVQIKTIEVQSRHQREGNHKWNRCTDNAIHKGFFWARFEPENESIEQQARKHKSQSIIEIFSIVLDIHPNHQHCIHEEHERDCAERQTPAPQHQEEK